MPIPAGHHLFVIDIRYTAPYEDIESVRAPHMTFIQQCLDDGFILVSGPKVPRDGGLIIAVGECMDAVQARMAQDPFSTAGVVEMTFTEFDPGTRHPTLAALAQQA